MCCPESSPKECMEDTYKWFSKIQDVGMERCVIYFYPILKKKIEECDTNLRKKQIIWLVPRIPHTRQHKKMVNLNFEFFEKKFFIKWPFIYVLSWL